MSEKPKGPFTIWTDSGEGWVFTDFDTIKEALEADKFSSWVIQQPVRYKVTLETVDDAIEDARRQLAKEGE